AAECWGNHRLDCLAGGQEEQYLHCCIFARTPNFWTANARNLEASCNRLRRGPFQSGPAGCNGTQPQSQLIQVTASNL
ncbi:hypothetical protein ILYODFUR_022380, partial [Ilyodon furcidens]